MLADLGFYDDLGARQIAPMPVQRFVGGVGNGAELVSSPTGRRRGRDINRLLGDWRIGKAFGIAAQALLDIINNLALDDAVLHRLRQLAALPGSA